MSLPHYDQHRNLLFGIVIIFDEQNLESGRPVSLTRKGEDLTPGAEEFAQPKPAVQWAARVVGRGVQWLTFRVRKRKNWIPAQKHCRNDDQAFLTHGTIA
jgi:hypothetical protein